MRIVAIVQARMGSTRLPGKVLRPLHGKSVLAHVIERVGRADRLDEILIATTDAPADAAIAEEAARLGTFVFRGSEQDVLGRYVGAARAGAADVIVRVTADCPLFDGALLQAMFERFEQEPADYMSNVQRRTFPRGLDAEIFTRDALDHAGREARLPHEREHVTPYLYQHPEIFRLASFEGARDLSGHRWTLDTPEDWTFIETVYDALDRGEPFGTEAVLKLLNQQPELAKLNADVEQKKLTP